MDIIYDEEYRNYSKCTLAIGNFDGVHIGHQKVLKQALSISNNTESKGVMVFEPHPRTYFNPATPVFRLTPLDIKASIFAKLGYDFMAPICFDKNLAIMEPEYFVKDILVNKFNVSHVITGKDFAFGKKRSGNIELLSELGSKYNFTTSTIDIVSYRNEQPFSSSVIRKYLREGKPYKAAECLGYWWSIKGEVIHGDAIGKTMGFPTANIKINQDGCPKPGIYTTIVRRESSPNKPLLAATYISKEQAQKINGNIIENHILDFNEAIYGEALTVEFVEFIREDHDFNNNLRQLTKQISDDCTKARTTLENLLKPPLPFKDIGFNETIAQCNYKPSPCKFNLNNIKSA